ncbi:MAG: CehA/McbA family metallohydrolase [Sphingomonadales bacterium]
MIIKYISESIKTQGHLVLGLFIGVQFLALVTPAEAQWTNRYSKLDDFGHHVYLEQHELPILAHGQTDPAPSPDGKTLAFASQGWIWFLNFESGVATRVTKGSGVDSRPRWSPDGEQVAFVRDNGSDTSIIVLDIFKGSEMVINSEAIELDPEFSSDGSSLYYSSGISGSLSIYRHHLASGEKLQLTDLKQVERNIRRVPGSETILYLHGAGASRSLRLRDFISGEDKVIHEETLTYHLTADVHPKERLAVYSAPIDNDYHIWTVDLDDPRVNHRLTLGNSFALTPAFSADGTSIYFVDTNDKRQFRLKKIATYGGEISDVLIRKWSYGEKIGRAVINIREKGKAVTARVSIIRQDGHPVSFHEDATYFDPQSGRNYFYIDGKSSFSLPVGKYKIEAVRGPMTAVEKVELTVTSGRTVTADMEIETLWNSKAAGYVSADYHVHLNGDGHNRATHEHAMRLIEGENLDHLAPMTWNRWERKIDREILGKRTEKNGHVIDQGQEVRSHFHGHIGLSGVKVPFNPWFFGPNNPTLGDPDLTNGDVLAYAEEQKAFATYVHPISSDTDPFLALEENSIPLELVSDGVLTPLMGLEIVCAWTSPLGNSELWYRFLNIGKPVSAISGTDGWVDFYRTPAMGTGRNYVRIEDGGTDFSSVREAAASGHGFVTTGPALLFELEGGIKPGEITMMGIKKWTATLVSAVDVDIVEIIVNGKVVQTHKGVSGGQSKNFKGHVELPEGGWVAIRAYSSESPVDVWPSMHKRPFAHSSPIWINKIGSTERLSRVAAVNDLMSAIDAAEKSAKSAYGVVPMARMMARFDKARKVLESIK